MKKAENRHLIAVIPSKLNIQEVYKEMIIPDILRLERGVNVFFRSTGTTITICGGIHALQGITSLQFDNSSIP